MREEGSNDVTIFISSRYVYVGAGLVAGQMSLSQLQYFLIFFQIVCRDFPSIHSLARQQLPKSARSSKFFSLSRDFAIDIYEHCGIAYFELVTVFSDTLSSVEMASSAVGKIWQYVRTSYGTDILPTERPSISHDKIIIISIIIVVVVVTDFSDIELRVRRLLYRRSGGYGFRFRLLRDFEMSRWQRRRRLFLLLLLRVSFSTGVDAGSGKNFCRKSANAFICDLRVISDSPIFLRNLTHFS